MSGAGGLNKVGAGTLQLSAANTYGGPTVIASGTLQLSGGMPPVTAGLVGYWPLNEGTGTTAYDRSGIATPANGTLSGNASWVPVADAGTAGYPPFATAVQINGNSPGVTMGALSAFGNSTTSQFGSAHDLRLGRVGRAHFHAGLPWRLARHVRIHRPGRQRWDLLRHGVG